MYLRFGLCGVVLSASLNAQVAPGTITGVVEDTTGAHVATARVPHVHIGQDSVSTEAAGFKKKTVTGIEPKVDQTVSLTIELETGGVSESVEVTPSSPLVQSSTLLLGQAIENRKILDLPLCGRNTFALGLLPGKTSPVSGMGTNLPFVAGGDRFVLNEVLLDSIDNYTSIYIRIRGRDANPNFGKLGNSSATGRQAQFGLKLNF